MPAIRSLPSIVLGILAIGLGCRSRPLVRPTPRAILGRCLWLQFTPPAPPIDGWRPPDTLRLLTPYWLSETRDSSGVAEGDLDIAADTNENHFARWRLVPDHLYLRLWTPFDGRYINFDRLTQFAGPSALIRGRWIQRANLGGTVTGRFVPCPVSTAD